MNQNQRVEIDYSTLADHPDREAYVRSLLKTAYAPDVAAANQQVDDLQARCAEIERGIAFKQAEIQPIQQYVRDQNSKDGTHAFETYVTSRDKIRLSLVMLVILLLVFGDMWYLITGFRHSLVASFFGVSADSSDSSQYLIYCFISLAFIVLLKVIPSELLRSRQKLFRMFWAFIFTLAVLAFVVWILAWLDGVNPVTMSQAHTASWDHASKNPETWNPISALFHVLHLDPVLALFFCGISGSITASTTLWIYFDTVLDRKRAEVVNPDWVTRNKEIHDMHDRLGRLRAEIAKHQRAGANLELECQQRIGEHIHQSSLFLKKRELEKCQKEIASLTSEITEETKKLNSVRAEIEAYKTAWAKGQSDAIKRELEGGPIPFAFAFPQPEWDKDPSVLNFRAQASAIEKYIAELEVALKNKKNTLRERDGNNGTS